MEDFEDSFLLKIYMWMTKVAGLTTFICCYVYCIVEHGFLIGVGFGWIPSLIAAFIIPWFWPLITIAGITYLICK